GQRGCVGTDLTAFYGPDEQRIEAGSFAVDEAVAYDVAELLVGRTGVHDRVDETGVLDAGLVDRGVHPCVQVTVQRAGVDFAELDRWVVRLDRIDDEVGLAATRSVER